MTVAVAVAVAVALPEAPRQKVVRRIHRARLKNQGKPWV